MRKFFHIPCVWILFFIATPGNADQERPILMRIADSLLAGARDDKLETSSEVLCKGLNKLHGPDNLNCSAQSTQSQQHEKCLYVESVLQKCIQLAEKRRRVRLGTLGQKSKSDLENIPDCYRLPEEDQRLATIEAQELFRYKHELAIIESQKEHVRTNSEIMIPVLSEALCEMNHSEREARQDLDDRLRAQRHTTLIDPGTEYAQSELNRILDRRKKVLSDISIFRVRPLACKSQVLANLRGCQQSNLSTFCQTLKVKLLLETYDNYQRELYH